MDWFSLASTVALIGFGILALFFLGRKKRWAWFLSISSYAIWMLDMGRQGQWWYVVAGVIFVSLGFRSWILWGHTTDTNKPNHDENP